jgi:hypothetical protein
VPELRNGRSRFAPPEMIARDEPYCLFLDELNASAPEVQKAFYSLILDRRIGAYELPPGSIVIGAGNRTNDNALARPMASALVNRLVHVHLRASAVDWIGWAGQAGIHQWVLDYLTQRPDQLWVQPPRTEEPFSTPRAWHLLSDALHSYDSSGGSIAEETVRLLAHGTLTSQHANSFTAYLKTVRHRYGLDAIVRGDAAWPRAMSDRDLLFFFAESFRARLIRELPESREHAGRAVREFALRAKGLLVELAEISLECAQLVMAADAEGKPVLPAWFLVEVTRDLPRLVAARA